MATAMQLPVGIEGFRNEPYEDWNDPDDVRRMEAALETVRSQLGRTYPLIVDGREIHEGDLKDSVNPADPSQVIGRFVQADRALGNEAVEKAHEAFQEWSRVPYQERAAILFRAAEIMRQRKLELAAWMVFEVSKSWSEAVGDAAELIDFCEYYARMMMKLGGPQPVVQLPREQDELHYIPLGVTVVIPPWNFPGAIMGGMTAAALVAGNTVVLKPASTAPAIAYQFAEIMFEAGLPKKTLTFLPGPGSEIGDSLVDHPLTRMIAFTGSKEVGLRIFERASKVNEGQIWLKRTILEMGGKDAQVVDETADLDAAAEAIVLGAFGFQGQKCSACSRAIIVDEVYDEVLDKVVERTKQLTMGDTTQKGVFMGAVIDKSAFRSIREYIEIGKQEGRLVLGGEVDESREGYFIPPTIIADVAPDARIAQEEIFGPVCAFIRARDYDHALEIANGTEYGLTGGVFSRSRDRLDRARDEFHVGNLYLNRKITGAMVGAHPFGGFNMSGTDSKAGGPDYLLLFTQAKSIAELVRDDVPRRPRHTGTP
jgi:1-pyrroline-5-carboxylate dehydrogenase